MVDIMKNNNISFSHLFTMFKKNFINLQTMEESSEFDTHFQTNEKYFEIYNKNKKEKYGK